MQTTLTLTGKTYDARNNLKKYGATFDGASKTWSIDAAEWAEFKAAYPILSSGIRVAGATPSDGPCPHCGSYCAGDCQSH